MPYFFLLIHLCFVPHCFSFTHQQHLLFSFSSSYLANTTIPTITTTTSTTTTSTTAAAAARYCYSSPCLFLCPAPVPDRPLFSFCPPLSSFVQPLGLLLPVLLVQKQPKKLSFYISSVIPYTTSRTNIQKHKYALSLPCLVEPIDFSFSFSFCVRVCVLPLSSSLFFLSPLLP
ncbi:MAG: hypothetical protein JOS17DRAFT_759931 [Linnemannia elongata]|nr:MAG: hypothetical protein JOS17DRAFT_759931 [Linnemannia elongata]